MEKKNLSALLMLLVLVVSVGAYKDEGGSSTTPSGGSGEGTQSKLFLLQESKHVVKTEAGEMKVVKGITDKFVEKPMHIGFITMEPRSLFIPQYLDSSLIIFVRRGEARIGSIRDDELVEEQLKTGDVYRIDAGSTFYLENTGVGQRLQCICSIDTSESLNWHTFQSFFIGGGRNPTSILSGFDPQTLSTAFNVSMSELQEFMTSQQSGAIVYLSPDTQPPNKWTHFLKMDHQEKKARLNRLIRFEGEPAESKEDRPKWSLRKLLLSVFGEENKEKDKKRTTSDDVYNLYEKGPDFKNNYGWSLAVDESEFSALHSSGIGIYLVNLTAGSMMAPHINPTATEYGIVLRGSGTIQIVYPNGTLAMNSRVDEGDVFWVPRYFPFCQISSRTGPFEFFGFTTSSRKNRPQFLVGQNSLLQSMRGPEFAAAFGVPEERLEKLTDAQRESTILPTASVAPPDHYNGRAIRDDEEAGKVMIPRIVNKFSSDMMMGFD